jgi:chromosomal replication initiation ATPase DnaA
LKRKARIAADRARVAMAMSMAAAALDTTIEEASGDSRSMRAVFARQLAMYLASVGFGMSCSRVAAALGRDRSTVTHACSIMEERRDDPAFDRWIDALEQVAATTPVLA